MPALPAYEYALAGTHAECGTSLDEPGPLGLAAPAAGASQGSRRSWRAVGLLLGTVALLGLAVLALSSTGQLLHARPEAAEELAYSERMSVPVPEALEQRAHGRGGPLAHLTDTVKPKKAVKAAGRHHPLTCPGYGTKCANLPYPAPYGPGEWPTSYDYSGEFPQDFVWGFGTASYQIEGAYREDGRGASIWDTFSGANTVGMPGAACSYCCKQPPCDVNPAMFDKGATGNVAADHYHLYRTDVAMMKSMGLKHYRFSIAWPRLIPTGKLKDGVNEKGKAFYNNLIDALLEAGITPYVTLYHWDLPQGLLDPPRAQGWWSRDPETGEPNGQILPDWLDYVRTCFREFGDRVKVWVTFNEPWTFLYLGSGYGKAPGIPEFSNMTIDPWIGGHNMLNAHAAAVDLYRREFQKTQGGQIGITNNCDWREPKTDDPEDIAAAERAVLFQLGWFSEPIFGKEGDYPEPMRKLYGDRLPKFTTEQKRLLKGSADFYGLNHYGTGWAAYDPAEPGADTAYAKVTEEGFPNAMSVWLYGSGWGFRKLLNWVARRYDNPPLFVTEGGWSLPADTAEEAVADQGRVMYYANYSAEMLKAIREDGVDVRGYFAWSLMDNYEWERGYQERFGATYTDFQYGRDENAPTNKDMQPTEGAQWRRRKDSSCWLEAVYKDNKLVSPVKGGTFQGCVGSFVFNGKFEDPQHPGCLRRITLDISGTAAVIIGGAPKTSTPDCKSSEKGREECHEVETPKSCDGKSDETWSVDVPMVSGGSIIADFSGRGGPARLAGFWNSETSSIDWADGSSWKAAGGAEEQEFK